MMPSKRSATLLLLLSMFAMVAGIPRTFAQTTNYPNKPVVVIVPFSPGGRTDTIARLVTQHLTKDLHESFLVEDKPGAGSVLGSLEVARSKPDGYTLGFFSAAIITTQYMAPTPTSLADYAAISIVNTDPAALAVQASAKWKTLRDLVDYGQQNPGKLRIGVVPGAGDQLFAAGFMRAANVKAIQVPFKGSEPGVIALAAGNIDVYVGVPESFKSLLEAKKVRILAVAAKNRSSFYDNIPTYRDNGVDLVLGSFNGLFAPKGTPSSIVTKLANAVRKVMSDPSVIQRMTYLDAGVEFLGPSEAKTFLVDQDATYKTIIDALGLRVAPNR